MKGRQSSGNPFRFRSIRSRFIIPIALVVILGIVGTALGTARQVRIEANLAAVEKVKSDLRTGEALLNSRHPGPWHIRDGKLYKGETLMNENFAIVDEVGRLTGDTCTIFQGDTRVATNVLRDGKRAVGTKVSDEVAQVVLKERREYYGEADVVGVKYQTAYKPIVDSGGEVIGIWYVGANKQFVDKMIKDAVWNVTWTSCVALLAIIGLVWLLTNSLTRPIQHIVAQVDQAGKGNLNVTIEGAERRDELGRLARHLNELLTEFRSFMTHVRTEMNALLNAAGGISASMQQLSATGETQASELSNISEAVERMAGAIQEIASLSQKALTNSEETTRTASAGEAQAKTAMAGMQGIHQRMDELGRNSDQIGEIVATIQDIAEQTNLLAFNASIEAARAGAQGRGFAVVAEEVRRLAERSAQATREIGELVDKIQGAVRASRQAVEDGTKANNQAYEAFHSIAGRIKQVGAMVAEIAQATQAQTDASRRAADAAQAIVQVNEQATAATEEVAATAEKLAEMSRDLNERLNRFRIMD
ncbi:MAG: methyl-accepting chemotaxis protein [Thermoanaerobacterales bacterium]|nr:methyl-accepting chemotaxis protein [Thermoanaerobacterales bacterium]